MSEQIIDCVCEVAVSARDYAVSLAIRENIDNRRRLEARKRAALCNAPKPDESVGKARQAIALEAAKLITSMVDDCRRCDMFAQVDPSVESSCPIAESYTLFAKETRIQLEEMRGRQ
jgi:hypothetical protein